LDVMRRRVLVVEAIEHAREEWPGSFDDLGPSVEQCACGAWVEMTTCPECGAAVEQHSDEERLDADRRYVLDALFTALTTIDRGFESLSEDTLASLVTKTDRATGAAAKIAIATGAFGTRIEGKTEQARTAAARAVMKTFSEAWS